MTPPDKLLKMAVKRIGKLREKVRRMPVDCLKKNCLKIFQKLIDLKTYFFR
jgi:hypothetical protein